ncbi:MAG: CBS domain-containing protein [Syntrophus sp. (in: bacteria)]|nr:CBS domain-containing protein [Syntrophus sp. (in: bacteria)]
MFIVNARDMLKAKGYSDIFSISPDDSAYSALQLALEKNVMALTVVENNKLVGIVTERDYSRKITLAGGDPNATKVREIMTAPVISVNVNSTAAECLAVMSNNNIRHLPVFDGDKMVGIISIGNVVKATLSEHEDLIKHLNDYIQGTYV